jgi:hypothetical protein
MHELERQIHCFPYEERSDVPLLQQVEQKAIGRQRNLRLMLNMQLSSIYFTSTTVKPVYKEHKTFRDYRI